MKARSSAPLPRPEWWVLLLLTLVVAVVVGHLWVFHGPNRELALWLYKSGRFQAVIAAGVLGLAGIVTGLLRPPLVNPWRLVGLASVLFVVFSAPVPYAYPSSHRDHPSEVTLAMPVAGSWRVLSGGRTSHNALSLEPDRCHGLLLAREEHGTRWRTEQPEHVEPAESWTFGSELFAPAPGLVVAVQDGEPDRSFELRVEEASSRGNHIVLQLSDGAYLVLAHLLQGSVRVQVGDQVEVGQPIAQVGSSGRGIPLTEPHLDLHLSTLPGAGQGEGIPFRIGGYRLEGVVQPAGEPRGGLGVGDSAHGDLLEAIPFPGQAAQDPEVR